MGQLQTKNARLVLPALPTIEFFRSAHGIQGCRSDSAVGDAKASRDYSSGDFSVLKTYYDAAGIAN
jgi:hypothetical protein